MVNRRFRILLFSTALLAALPLGAKNLANYQVGDKVDEDIIATAPVSVVDPEATEALKQKEAFHVLAIVRYDTNAADEVEEHFRRNFEKTRNNFLKALNESFGHKQLGAEELTSEKFYSLIPSFAEENRMFPVSTNRAVLWASGDADEAYESSLAATLRQSLAPIIRPEPLPEGIKLGTNVRLVTVGGSNETLTAQSAERRGKSFPRSNLVVLASVRKDFQSVFGPEEHDVARYLAGLIKPNCTVEEAITRQLRDKRTEDLWAVTNFAAGDIIAHRGQVIDKKIKAAIDQLKDKAVVGQLQDLQVKQQAAVGQLQQMMAEDKARTAQNQDRNRWLIGALAGVVFVLAAAIWQLSRRKQSVSLLPVPVSGTAEQWQQRALEAEQQAEKLRAAARSGLFAHLSQWLSSALTMKLLSQRRLMLENQSKAISEMAEMEARLEKVHAPLNDRLAAYQRRITELEKELEARGQENRELLKAKIEIMRKQLEAQQGKNRLEFN